MKDRCWRLERPKAKIVLQATWIAASKEEGPGGHQSSPPAPKLFNWRCIKSYLKADLCVVKQVVDMAAS